MSTIQNILCGNIDWHIEQGDCLSLLRMMPDKSVHCCVTSPPYWNLRDYGVPGQLGLESTPEEYVAKMVEVFREVWRVLRDDGTLWLNLGDSYCPSAPGTMGDNIHIEGTKEATKRARKIMRPQIPEGLKKKDLIGIPWRVAFALQADGWYLRSDIIWSKPNPMPESVTDRPTKAHEYIFLLAKSGRYYYDHEAIKEEGTTHLYDKRYGPGAPGREREAEQWNQQGPYKPHKGFKSLDTTHGRNKRTVWTVATQPFPGAHFATFPPKLIEPCILAGSSPYACPECGAPWVRILEKGEPVPTGKGGSKKWTEVVRQYRGDKSTEKSCLATGAISPAITLGWQPKCSCQGNDGSGKCVILDPFNGAATTGVVALRHGRRYIGIELNPEYVEMSKRRIEDDMPLFNRLVME